jgi:excisionase family DNA binding protein
VPVSQSPYLTAAEVAAELGISRHGVYKLIERGKLKAIRRSERNLRVSRLALDAYRRRLNNGAPAVEVVDTVDVPAEVAAFERETGMSPVEWERRWKADRIEDTAENMRLTIRALALRAAGESPQTVDPVVTAALGRR